jgi:hypothetical protein
VRETTLLTAHSQTFMHSCTPSPLYCRRQSVSYRLKTLSSAVEQLAEHSKRRAYEDAAPLLEASILMFTHFTEYRDVPKVSEMASKVEKIRLELK